MDPALIILLPGALFSFGWLAADLQSLASSIGKGIALLHNASIVHGDLTTSNMMLRAVQGDGAPVEWIHSDRPPLPTHPLPAAVPTSAGHPDAPTGGAVQSDIIDDSAATATAAVRTSGGGISLGGAAALPAAAEPTDSADRPIDHKLVSR